MAKMYKAGSNGLKVGATLVHLPGTLVSAEDVKTWGWQDDVVSADENVEAGDMGVGAASSPSTASDPKKAASKTNGASDA